MKENQLAPALDSVQFPRNTGEENGKEEGKEECVGVQIISLQVSKCGLKVGVGSGEES